MRNLKRALSLALAAIMLLGMMVVGASAVSYNDFSDRTEIVNKDAVSMLTTLGVIDGKPDGSYAPEEFVTREQMAKMISVIMNQGSDNNDLFVGVPSGLTDVAGNWALGHINYCYSLGIIAGRGDGRFDPTANVTASEAAKMLLVAMGYDSNIFEFTGMDWEINVNRRANEAKLYEEIKSIDTSVGLSRDNTAQMAYNALEAKIMTTTYDKVVSSGEVSWSYGLSNETFLNKYFDAYTWVGTFAGNYNTGKAVLGLLQDTCRRTGRTVLVITHNGALTAMADRVIRIKSGRAISNEVNQNPIPVEEIEW